MINLLVRLFVKNPDDTDNTDVRLAYGKMAGWVGIVSNLVLTISKVLAGFFAGSIAIMADGINNLSDAASSVVTLFGFHLSAKPADDEHPYGHGRFEYIAGLIVAMMVMIVGLELSISSIGRIVTPQPVSYSWLSYAALIFSIVLKLWMAVFNRNIGRRIDSPALEQATFADSRNDAIATFVVLLSTVIAQFTGVHLDGWMGLAVSLFILISGGQLVKETLDPLLGEAPDAAMVSYVRDKISGYPDVIGTHDLMIHDYGPGRRFASAHVEMSRHDDVVESHRIIDQIEKDFLEQDQIHMIIHHDPVDEFDHKRQFVLDQVHSIDKRLVVHDFESDWVDGKLHFTFNVTTPPDYELDSDTLDKKIKKKMVYNNKPVQLTMEINQGYAPVQNIEG